MPSQPEQQGQQPNLDPREALEVARSAAEAGAAELLEGFGGQLDIRLKGAIDLVTDYDLRSETAVRRVISGAFPEHQIHGEEGGLDSSCPSRYVWYVDPLDGTTNFSRSHPFFAVSVALWGPIGDGREGLLAGIVLAPVLRESFWALRGGGAYHRRELPGREARDEPIRVAGTKKIGNSLAATGFPYDVFERAGEIVRPLERVLSRARALRRDGAASLDLSFVAAGRADAFFESGLKPWDVAGGILLVEEAGGKVSDYRGQGYVLGQSQDILATNFCLHEDYLGLLT